MADLQFNNILKELKEIHKDHPEVNFGKVLQTALDRKTKKFNVDFHQISSKQIKLALETFRLELDNIKFKNKELATQEKIRKEKLLNKLTRV